ncbi:MAG: hypothetical protein ABIQ18_16165 [Umezawaea sp.]
MSLDARFVLAVLTRSPIPVSEIDVRLVHDLVDGPPEHTEHVLDDLLGAGELTEGWAGVWALTRVPAADDDLVHARRARRGHDPQDALLRWLVGLAVAADRAVDPLSWRPSSDTTNSWPFDGRTGAIAWWELHRAQLLTLVDLLSARGSWSLTWTLADAVCGLAQATGYAHAQVTTAKLGLWAVEADHHDAVDQDHGQDRLAGYLVRRAWFTVRLATGTGDVGGHDTAQRLADQGVDYARRSGDPAVLSSALRARARIIHAAHAVRRYDHAIHDLRQALALDLARGDLAAQGLDRRRLGELLAAADRGPEGLAELEQAVELLGRAGDEVGRAVAFTVAGHLLVDADQVGQALPQLRDALTVLAPVGTPWQLARTYHGLARAAHVTGAHEIESTYRRRAAAFYRDANAPQLAADLDATADDHD